MSLARLATTVAVVGSLSASFASDVAAQSSSQQLTAADAAPPQHAAAPRIRQAAERYPALSFRLGGEDEPARKTTTETYGEHGFGRERGEDDVAARQSIDAFSLLEDGQPSAPGAFELQLDFGWETASGEHDPSSIVTELKYTPDGNDFLRNMKLTLVVPVELGLGGVEGNADLEFGWQQRWVPEDGMMPTLATLAEVRIPSGYHSSGVDGTLTGIIAKDVGPGTAYLNGFIKTANSDNVEDLRDFQWGASTGYRWRINDQFALIGGYVIRSSEEYGHGNVNLLEFSGEYHVNEHLIIGPGIFIGLDDNEETPNFGAGVRVTIPF